MFGIEFHNKDMGISKERGEKPEVMKPRRNPGVAYQLIGQYQLAIKCHTEDLEIAKRMGDKVGEGEAYENLGIAHNNIGEYGIAIEFHTKHLEIAEELGDQAGMGRAHANLGNAYHSDGQYQMAIQCHDKELEIAKELGDIAGVGKAYGSRGNAYYSTGENQMAIDSYKKYLDIAEELGDISGSAIAQFFLGLAHQRDSDDQACRHFAKSIIDFHNIRRDGNYQDKFNVSMSNMFADVQRFLLRSLLNLNQIKAALLVSDNGKASALYDLTKKYVDVVGDSTLADQETRLFHAISDDPSSKSMEIFFDNAHPQIKPFKQDGSIIFYSFDSCADLNIWFMSRDGVYHKQWQAGNTMSMLRYVKFMVACVRHHLLGAARTYFIPDAKNYGCHGKFERKVAEHWNIKPLEEKEPAYVRDLENLRDLPGEKSVKERYHLEDPMQRCGSSCYSAGNIEDTERAERKLCESYSLDMPDATHASRSSSREPGTKSLNSYTDPDEYLEKLYSILIAPYEEHLTGSKLLIVPDGPLFQVPFCALLKEKKSHLCEKYSLQITPALQVLDASLLKPFRKLGPALFVGNPTVGEVKVGGELDTLEALPYATNEAKGCAEYFRAGPLLEENATKAKVLKNMKDASVIHIAAHGHMNHADIFLAPNEGAPKPPREKHYLLTAADILKCHLNARLVVLSCCYSGRGKISNEGVVGIARSFLGAGAQSVLVTLWKILDEKTMEFMKQFYSKVCQGVSVCSSLQETMIEFKKKVPVPVWAPFQIVGEDIVLTDKEIEEIRRESSMRTSQESASNPNDVHGRSDV